MVVMEDNGLRNVTYFNATSADLGLISKSSNADLSNLALSQGTLAPGFSTGTLNYTASVGNAVTTIGITPTVADPKATVTVNGTVVGSGIATSVPLNVGSNSIPILVKAENGTTTKTYTLTITRAALSNNSFLSNLTVNSGALSPLFNQSIQLYNVRVPNLTGTIRFTPTVADPKATVTVGGNPVISGQESAPITLLPGLNPISAIVKAENGTTSTYTVNVNRNRPPNAPTSTFAINENAPTGSAVGIFSGSDPDGDSLTYSILSGNTNNVFSLNPSTGEIKVANGSFLDYETTQFYPLTIQVSDGLDQTTANVTINVNNLNDNNPSAQGFTKTIDENTANGTSVGTVIATDPDAGTHFSYSITSGNADGAFAIDANSGEVKVADSSKLDYETVKSFTLTVQVSDGQHTANTTVTINLNNLNDNQPVMNDEVFNVDENAAIGTLVGTVIGTDADNDPISYGILSGNETGAFAIDPVTGKITVADGSKLDYETQTAYQLRVQATDNMAALNLSSPFSKMAALFAYSATPTDTATITINVNDLNDNIPVPNGFTTIIDENTANDTPVGTVTATDADAGSRFSYSIIGGNADSAFAINPSTGEIAVADTTKLDYETVQSFALTVQVSDGKNTADTAVTINLKDVNDNPPMVKNAVFNVDENAPSGTSVGTVTASDADTGSHFSYSITTGNSAGTFAIDASSGEITVADPAKLDYETVKNLVLTVRVSDGTNTTDAVVTINLKDVNDNPPVVKDARFSMNENAANGTTVGQITATDADTGSIFSYSITSGNSTGAFAINPSSGEITVANSAKLDYETVQSFTLTVQVSDGKNTADAVVTIHLNNVNDNLPVLEHAEFTIDENAANGTSVGTITATDADVGSTLSYSLFTSGTSAGAFAINPSTGEITVVDSTKLDYETVQSFTLPVKVTDGTNIAEATVTIHLNNLNDNPPVAEDTVFKINENAANGTEVGTVVASDADHDSVSYSIVNGNEAGAFAIDAATGKITVADATKLDYETVKNFALTVQVSDGKNKSNAAVTISLNNLNDNQPVTNDAVFKVDENAANGTEVGTVTASDADRDSLRYRILSGNETDAFTIDADTGKVTVADSTKLDFEKIRSYTLTIQVSDGTHMADSQVTIDLNNLNDNPPIGDDNEFSIDEKAANGTALGTVTTSDADGDAVTYTITSGNDNGVFEMNRSTGEITVANGLRLDAGTRTLSVRASDGKHAATINVTVNVLSIDATLSHLTTSTGDLNPEFKPGTTHYTMNVGEKIKSIKLTPTTVESHATVKINGQSATSGQESDAISLNPGKNSITIEVTAQNGQTATYTLTVTRLQSVVPVAPVKDGGTVNFSDDEVNLVDDNGIVVVELNKSLDEVKAIHFTALQLETLINRKAMIKVVKHDIQLLIPAANFAIGEDLTFSLEKVDKNPENLPSSNLAIGAVYDFTIKQGDKIISHFDHEIELAFPTEGVAHPEELKVYFWNKDKKKWELVGGTYENGQIKAMTNHFGTFAVFRPNDLDGKKLSSGSNLPNTATNMYNWLFAGILILMFGGAMFLVPRLRHKDE